MSTPSRSRGRAVEDVPSNVWGAVRPGSVPSATPTPAICARAPVGASATPAPAASPAAAPRPALAHSSRAPIQVTVGQPEEAGGETRLTQSFVLPHARADVWRLMSDVQEIARCMPGVELDGPPVGDKLSGRLEAKIGPITASFAGEGTLQSFPDEVRQVIDGRGGDRRSGSRAAGRVDYRLSAIPGKSGSEATRVDVVIAYALTGPLAQIGRSGLVRDLVRRIGETFAQNLDTRLYDPAAAMPQAQLGGLSLLLRVLADRARTLLARLGGRTG